LFVGGLKKKQLSCYNIGLFQTFYTLYNTSYY
jgi:hypothetical protein